MSPWGSFDVVVAALSSGAACFAVALALLASVLTWSSAMTHKTELLFSRSIWGCVAVGCALVAAACVMVLMSPARLESSF